MSVSLSLVEKIAVVLPIKSRTNFVAGKFPAGVGNAKFLCGAIIFPPGLPGTA
jgi:hypothetical protein